MANPTATKTRRKTQRANGLALDRKPSSTVDLLFQDSTDLDHVDDPIWSDVSALAVIGRSIFCACDETASVERVVLDTATGKADSHTSFALGDTFDLPDGPGGEMDIEGLAIADGHLRVCGSHSLKRDDPEDNGLADDDALIGAYVDLPCNRSKTRRRHRTARTTKSNRFDIFRPCT